MFQCHMCDEYSDSINIFSRNMHGVQNKIYREKCITMTALWCTTFSNDADFIVLETKQPIIVIILIIYSPYLLKDLV